MILHLLMNIQKNSILKNHLKIIKKIKYHSSKQKKYGININWLFKKNNNNNNNNNNFKYYKNL